MPDRPKVVATTTKFTHEDVRKKIDTLARDHSLMSRLLRYSSSLWRRDSPEDLLQDTFRRLLKMNPDIIRADIPFHKTVAFYMTRQAVEWGRRAEPRNHVSADMNTIEAAVSPGTGRKPARSSSDEAMSDGKGMTALAGWYAQQRARTPEDDCHAHQVLNILFEKIAEDEPMRRYMDQRYVDGLTGEDLQAALGLESREFGNLTRRANRLLADIRSEISR